MFGRGIGVAFALPMLYFASRGYLQGVVRKRVMMLLGLGAAQGGIGWWMVKSGLKDQGNETYNDLPRVSPYRLATHLGMAFLLLGGLSYTALELSGKGGPGTAVWAGALNRAPVAVRRCVTACSVLAYLTA